MRLFSKMLNYSPKVLILEYQGMSENVDKSLGDVKEYEIP